MVPLAEVTDGENSNADKSPCPPHPTRESHLHSLAEEPRWPPPQHKACSKHSRIIRAPAQPQHRLCVCYLSPAASPPTSSCYPPLSLVLAAKILSPHLRAQTQASSLLHFCARLPVSNSLFRARSSIYVSKGTVSPLCTERVNTLFV